MASNWARMRASFSSLPNWSPTSLTARQPMASFTASRWYFSWREFWQRRISLGENFPSWSTSFWRTSRPRSSVTRHSPVETSAKQTPQRFFPVATAQR